MALLEMERWEMRLQTNCGMNDYDTRTVVGEEVRMFMLDRKWVSRGTSVRLGIESTITSGVSSTSGKTEMILKGKQKLCNKWCRRFGEKL